MAACNPIEVFLSYSNADKPLATVLASALEKSGVNIWWDAYLDATAPFEETVKNVLLRTEIIVGILTRTSIQSPWVRWELGQAHENGLRVVPLLADGLQKNDLPPPFDENTHSLVLGPEQNPTSIKAIVRSIEQMVLTARTVSTMYSAKSKAVAASDLAEASLRHVKGPPKPRINDEKDYITSNGFAAFLNTHNISITFSSFPLSLLCSINQNKSEDSMLSVTHAPEVRGLYAEGDTILAACETYIAELQYNAKNEDDAQQNATYFFRWRHKLFTGSLDTHDVALTPSRTVIFANTRYSCLSTVSKTQSHEPVWRPSFISELAPEDRCHLNGFAMKDGKPAFVSAAAHANTIDGWRNNRANGGIIIDIQDNRVICEGLSMPHSPRFHDCKLWILNSGAGELGIIDITKRKGHLYEKVAFLTGFLKGLAFVEHFAVVGLSRPRHGSFEGLPLRDQLENKQLPPWSGIAIVDTRSGQMIEWFRLTGRIWEVSDLVILHNT